MGHSGQERPNSPKFFAEALRGTGQRGDKSHFRLGSSLLDGPALYHLDVYRVNDEDEFLELGVEEMFDENGDRDGEWGSKFSGCCHQII